MTRQRSVSACLVFAGVLLLPVLTAHAQRCLTCQRATSQMTAQRDAIVAAAREQQQLGQMLLAAARVKGVNAQARLNEILDKMRASVAQMHAAATREVDWKKDLSEIEAQILKEQPSNSPVLVAHSAMKAKHAAASRLEAKLLTTPAYLAKKATLAKTPGGGAMLVAQHRQDALDASPEYIHLQLSVDAHASELNALKHALFAQDADWKSAREEMIGSRKDARAANAQVWLAAPQRGAPRREMLSAAQAANAAREMIAQAEEVLDRCNANTVALNSGEVR